VIFPDAPQLDGVTQRLLRRALEAAGRSWSVERVCVSDLAALDGACLLNASGLRAIAAVDAVEWSGSGALTSLLQQCYDCVPWERL
jgi:hypothetical protein